MVYRAGSGGGGYLDDYAYLIQGASVDVRLLSWAVKLQESRDHLFWDAKLGGYFTPSGKDPSIILRTREAYDGGEPSPNSVATLKLLRLRGTKCGIGNFRLYQRRADWSTSRIASITNWG